MRVVLVLHRRLGTRERPPGHPQPRRHTQHQIRCRRRQGEAGDGRGQGRTKLSRRQRSRRQVTGKSRPSSHRVQLKSRWPQRGPRGDLRRCDPALQTFRGGRSQGCRASCRQKRRFCRLTRTHRKPSVASRAFLPDRKENSTFVQICPEPRRRPGTALGEGLVYP